MKYNLKNNKGFSLIELSIVLIIMGLLVAGITGGASLIKSAQLNSVVRESQTYRAAYNTFFNQFNRVPGATTSEPNTVVGANAWTELRENDIIDKDPNNEAIRGLASKYKGANWYLANGSDTAIKSKLTGTLEEFNSINVLYIAGKHNLSEGAFSEIDAAGLDAKIDDGFAEEGLVRRIEVTSGTTSGFNIINQSYASGNETPTPKESGYKNTKAEKTTALIMKLDF